MTKKTVSQFCLTVKLFLGKKKYGAKDKHVSVVNLILERRETL